MYSYNFIEFDEIQNHKGTNIDVIGRASSLDLHGLQKEGDMEKREIMLTNNRGQQINAVTFLV